MAIIQWFPGHMAKARREIGEKLGLVDLVIELRDARIPAASKNPMVDEIVGNKPRLILLNKANMADNKITKGWIDKLSSDNTICLDIDCLTGYNINKIVSSAKEVLKDKIAKNKEKGLINDSIKAVVLGIPNVGKSTFINTLSKRKATKVGDRPGVTKGQSWIKTSENLMLLDTPGILWPKFEDQLVGIKLAVCGSIKDEILDLEDVCLYALDYLKENYPHLLEERFALSNIASMDKMEILKAIGQNRGCLQKGGNVDVERTITIIINDIRSCRIGAISFEREC